MPGEFRAIGLLLNRIPGSCWPNFFHVHGNLGFLVTCLPTLDGETLGSQEYHPRGTRELISQQIYFFCSLAVPRVGAPENFPANNSLLCKVLMIIMAPTLLSYDGNLEQTNWLRAEQDFSLLGYVTLSCLGHLYAPSW